MRVDADEPIAGHLTATAELIRRSGGFVAPDLTVHCTGGDFWCSIGSAIGTPDRVLLDYPVELTVPMSGISWDDGPNQLIPIDGLSDLTPIQRELLDHWLAMVNATGKLAQVRNRVPRFAVTDLHLRDLLTTAGYEHMAGAPEAQGVRDTLIGWHSMNSGGPRAAAVPRWRLIPLRHFANHNPDGAVQEPVRDSVRLLTSATSDAAQTFENYGDLDALRLLMIFGYVDDSARLVHSLPVTVSGGALGQVRVVSRPPRSASGMTSGTAGGRPAPDVPVLTRTAAGVDLAHLNIRHDNRTRLSEYLSLPFQTCGLSPTAADVAAEKLLDELISANLAFYDLLGTTAQELAPVDAAEPAARSRATDVYSMLAAVADLQRTRLTAWGRCE